MRSFCLMLCRFAISAWVGAAGLFVVTSVEEQQTITDLPTRNLLATLRFPYYYAFGFTLVAVGFIAGLIAFRHPAISSRRLGIALALLAVALGLMVVDYVWIYQPLREMLIPPESPRPSNFAAYHNGSKYINEADVTLCLLAALLLCWPGRPPAAPAASADSRQAAV